MCTDKPSLADLAVQTLAMVAEMDAGLDMEHPERHVIRNLKLVAQSSIEDAFRSATRMALLAKDMRAATREAEARPVRVRNLD